jgi:anti-sigma factor RsiW
MSRPTPINCEEALRLLAEYLDGELDGVARDDVALHLERCRSCYSRSEFERRLKERVGALREAPVPAPFERRIRELLTSFAAADDGTATTPHPDPVTP